MLLTVPAYVEDRIRRPPPPGVGVVPGSTAVVAFGDVRRLATPRSLGVNDVAMAVPEAVEQVYSECLTYYRRNPCRRWFDWLEAVLDHLGASYYAGSACHVDLAQWATGPTWARLPAPARRRLFEHDAPFLLTQLQRERFNALLANGRAVLDQLRRLPPITLTEQRSARETGYRGTASVFTPVLYARLSVVPWTTNLQSSVGLTNALRQPIAERAAELLYAPGHVDESGP